MPADAAQPESLETNQPVLSILPSNNNFVTDQLQTERVRHSPYPLRVRQKKHIWSLVSLPEPKEPTSLSEAMQSSQANHWRVAMQEEYDSLIRNETWSLTQLPPNRTAIKTRWVFKVKEESDGSTTRFKARLVAKGFSQRPGIDFEETYSPVVKYDTLRVILSLVAAKDLDMAQLDIKTAFLNGELDEEIYIEQPEGYVAEGKGNLVCRLNKCLYGLKQASRVWNRHFDFFLKKFGLTPSDADPCLYVRSSKEEFASVAIWVDDGLVCANNPKLTTAIINYLMQHFEMRHSSVSQFVGIKIARNKQLGTIHISQPDYIRKLIVRFHMTDCHPLAVPADPNCRLDESATESNEKFPYKEAIGSLMYLTTVSRPDIAFAVGQASRHCENPNRQHWAAVRRILAYLQGTQDYGICFGQTKDDLCGFSDSDYAGDPSTRKSTTGYLFLLNGGPVAWSSKRQPCVALSSTEAELIAACEATKEAICLRRLLSDLEPDLGGPVPIMCDNQSTIQLVKNPVHHQRTKHIDVRYKFITGHQEEGEIDIKYITTQEQLADPLNKPISNPRFSSLRFLSGVTSVPIAN